MMFVTLFVIFDHFVQMLCSWSFSRSYFKIEGAKIETNSLDAREILESISLEPNENLISLDAKSLLTSVPIKEAIYIALRNPYEQDDRPSIARKTMKRLLNMAVSQF